MQITLNRARAHGAHGRTTMTDDTARLASTGQIFVTAAAAQRYADYEGCQIEAARKDLTLLLCDAKLVAEKPDGSQQWRFRRRSLGLDISATIVREDTLAVVVDVNIRGDARRGR